MRRSFAPSSQSASKRLRFLSPFINNDDFQLDKENDFITIPKPKQESSILSSGNKSEASFDTSSVSIVQRGTLSNAVRSTDEILKLISEPITPISSIPEEKNDISVSSNVTNPSKTCDKITITEKRILNTSKKTIGQDVKIKDMNFQSSPTIPCSDATKADVFCFNVMWCKRSAKKHKVWEGDGILIVSNRSAVLKNMEGKVIDRGIGYKLKEIEMLEEGSKFYIGGKECEIQCSIPAEGNDASVSANSSDSNSMSSLNHKLTSM